MAGSPGKKKHRGGLCGVIATVLLAALFLLAAPWLPSAAAAEPTATSANPGATVAVFTPEQLEQMLAPIALYPDPLLAQVLMAATYPGEVAEAVKWSHEHPKAQGDEAVKQVADQPWDPSVQALAAFPQVLATLGQDPVWVQRLGDAFLAQPDSLMDAVQRLRRQAQAAGTLQSNQYQSVTAQAPGAAAGSTSTIIIQPSNPQVVYVPSYNPATAYGAWPYPASPPMYYPPPPAYYPGSALVAGLAFGAGVAAIGALWGECDWGDNDIDIDVQRYNNININNRISNTQNKWQHNAAHRDGVPYRDSRSREQYGRQLAGASQRQAYRGDEARRANSLEQPRDKSREQARAAMERHGIERPATSNRNARERVRAAQAGGRAVGAGQARNNAFAGARTPAQARTQASRGWASQAAAQRPNAVRAQGHQINRPASFQARQRGGRR